MNLTFRAFSASTKFCAWPGPLAQGGVPNRASRLGCETITFRAFGACGFSIRTPPRIGFDKRIAEAVANAVEEAAYETGVARRDRAKDEV